MTNEVLQVKIKERLNKLDSSDYPNLPCWTIAEAVNKAQIQVVRRMLQGINQTRTGAEGSTRRIDDLQVLLTTWTGPFSKRDTYYESCSFPDDYMQYNRIGAKAKNDCCPPRSLVIYLSEVADVNILLRDFNKRPSFDWAETFSTISGNRFRIYTNNEFEVCDPYVVYFRQPRKIEFAGCTDPYTNLPVGVNVECELPDNFVESVIIDEAAAILAGDIENQLQMARESQSSQFNT